LPPLFFIGEKMKKQTENTLAVLATEFMSFVGILTETSLNVTFPAMMKQFNVSLDTIQWTTTGYLLMIAIIMISYSYQNERFTAKQLFVTAAIAFMVGSIISAFALNFYILLLGSLRCGSLYTNDV
jgi:DHA2 family lincomycin resistance protein-like MFS transporter